MKVIQKAAWMATPLPPTGPEGANRRPSRAATRVMRAGTSPAPSVPTNRACARPRPAKDSTVKGLPSNGTRGPSPVPSRQKSNKPSTGIAPAQAHASEVTRAPRRRATSHHPKNKETARAAPAHRVATASADRRPAANQAPCALGCLVARSHAHRAENANAVKSGSAVTRWAARVNSGLSAAARHASIKAPPRRNEAIAAVRRATTTASDATDTTRPAQSAGTPAATSGARASGSPGGQYKARSGRGRPTTATGDASSPVWATRHAIPR